MWARVKKGLKALMAGSLWLVVLVPILGVSAYSLYFIGRYLGAPWFIAAAFSTCFDGVALLAADYSIKYAQEGMSGSAPKTIVRLFALGSAYIQTLHARIGHEPPGSWVIWAGLPIGAMVVHEIHLRFTRRKVLAKTGAAYPSPLPSFGIMTWVLFPITTMVVLREIVARRREVLVRIAKEYGESVASEHKVKKVRTASEVVSPANEVVSPANETSEDPVAQTENHQVVPITSAPGGKHAPTRHIRHWAQRVAGDAEHPTWRRPGDRARLPAFMIEAYYREHGQTGTGTDGGP
jgi:Protein of unknown function (DUF2637)